MARLEKLPNELLFMIFGYLDHDSHFCLLQLGGRIQRVVVERYCVPTLREFQAMGPMVSLALKRSGWNDPGDLEGISDEDVGVVTTL